MPNILRLVIPGLLESGPVEPELPSPEALQRLLGRATVQALEAVGADATLLQLFGLTPGTDRDLPVATVTRLADGGAPGPDWWLRADPVYLRADLRQVLLFDARILAISAAEAQVLAAEFNRVFGADGLNLEAPHPSRWYLRLEQDPGLRTCPLSEAIGRDINPLLPKGPAARRWHSLLTEIQMLFHDNPVNLEREARGQPTVNSVWFWGGGTLPQSVRSPSDGVYAVDPLVRGLARLAGVAVSPLPDHAADWREASQGETDSLVVLEATRYAGADREPAAWIEQISALERDWFAPCLAMLKAKTLDRLYLYPCNGKVYKVERGDLLRFWRRSRPLAHYRL